MKQKANSASIVKIAVAVIIVVLLVITGVLFYIKRTPKIPQAAFPVQQIKNPSCSYQIPEGWEQYGESSNDFQAVYVVKGSDMTKSVSNITINISQVAGKKNTIKGMYDEFGKSYEDAVLGVYPKAKDFSMNDYKSPKYDVFTADYTIVTETGDEVSCVQYYPLRDFYSIVITTMDAHDGNGDNIEDYAKNIVNTIEITKKEKKVKK